MDIGGIIIAVVNAILAIGCGWPLATMLSRLRSQPRSRVPTLGVLFAIYLGEGAAFAAGMGTNIFGVCLAVVWGFVLAAWLPKSRIPVGEWRRTVRLLACYTTLPAASFLAVPVMCALGGWAVLDPEAGARFGVPGFLPWPLNTILGLSVLVAGSGVVAKVALTTAIAGMLTRHSRNIDTGLPGQPVQ